ncbi:MAG TPA: histidinol-phosphate transaminase [Fimbriimonadaceae bacterium]|jgi:histidinol-phosphate aminotransferase
MAAPIRPNVLGLTPYSPGKPIDEVKRELGIDSVIKLASNENPLGPSPKAIAAVENAAWSMNIYPDGSGYALKQALSKRFQLPTGQIVLGNGSDELIHLLGLVFLGSEQDEVVVGDPSFVRYDAAAQLAPSKLIKVPLDSDYKHDLVAMRKRVNDNTKLVFIANPNNPTGTVVLKKELDHFFSDLPKNTVVVLDEAYFEFAEGLADFPNSLDYVREGRNVVGLRTFSKTYGLAGIRIGYAFTTPAIADGLDRAREPFNVNSLAQVAAIAALDDREHIQETLANNRKGMSRVNRALRAHGAHACESYANFVFADLGRPAGPVFQALLKKGVIIRSGEIFGTPNCVRITIGTEDEIDRFIQAFDEVINEGRF